MNETPTSLIPSHIHLSDETKQVSHSHRERERGRERFFVEDHGKEAGASALAIVNANAILLLIWSINGGGHGAGEGGGGDPDHNDVPSGGQYDFPRRHDVVRGPRGRPPGRPPERAGLGLRARYGRLQPDPRGRAVLRAGHARVPRLLRLQQLLPAERQLRHRVQLRRDRHAHQKRPELRKMCLLRIQHGLIRAATARARSWPFRAQISRDCAGVLLK